QLSVGLSQRLQDIAEQYQVTPFMLLHAAVALVISRHSNNTDIVIGTPVANRMRQELTPLIGFFVNTLVLRTDTRIKSGQHTFVDFLQQVKTVNVDGQANQDVPFEQLVEHCKVPRSMALTPLFQINFNFDTNVIGALNLPKVTLSPMKGADILAKFDLDISAEINEAGIKFSWVYDQSIFNHSRIEIFSAHLHRLLDNIAQNPEIKLADLTMLSATETEQLLPDLKRPQPHEPQKQTFGQRFEAQVAAQPNAIALMFGGEVLGYETLNQRANQLAHYLIEQGVKTDTLVGLCLSRCVEMMVGLLAITKAGGAWVPLDPTHPVDRLNHMLADTGAKPLLSRTGLTDDLTLPAGLTPLLLDAPEHLQQMQQYSLSDPSSAPKALGEQGPLRLAYVIYTS
ncbi:MAG: condensation domain-containing protein, partial [Psychrosphaera sp.]|nr:condensation domain-containing protein [Psychrosphaera sp.]